MLFIEIPTADKHGQIMWDHQPYTLLVHFISFMKKSSDESKWFHYPRPITSCAIQGSLLGGFLFLFHPKDVFNVGRNGVLFLFADDIVDTSQPETPGSTFTEKTLSDIPQRLSQRMYDEVFIWIKLFTVPQAHLIQKEKCNWNSNHPH